MLHLHRMVSEKQSEFPLPSSLGEPLILSFFSGLALLGCGAAIWNLAHPQMVSTPELIAGLVWLALCALQVGSFLVFLGIEKSVLLFLQIWSQDRYLCVLNDDYKGQRLWSGFRFLGLTFRVLEVPVSGVQSLAWSLGQASSRMGKDMDDWMVFFTLSTESVIYQTGYRCVNETSYYFTGLGGSKQKMESDVECLVEFLKAQDVSLEPGDKTNLLVPSA
jgi:hypothetical protein